MQKLPTVFAIAAYAVLSTTGVTSAGATYPLQVCEYPSSNTNQQHNCAKTVTVNRGSKYFSIPATCRKSDGKDFVPGLLQCSTQSGDGYPCTKSVTIKNKNGVCYMHWGDNPPNSSVTKQIGIYMQCQPGKKLVPVSANQCL